MIKMKIRPYGILLSLLFILQLFLCPLRASYCGGWYILKNDTHTPPPLDSYLSYVTDCGGYYLDMHAKEDDRVIYLTLDTGYENGNIEKILDVMKKHNAHGAFFVLSHLIEANTALVKRMGDEGHLLCNHTMSHKDMTAVDEATFCAELRGLETLLKEKTGAKMAPYYRPPEGKFDETSLLRAQDLGYKTIFWSYAYADWDNEKQPDAAAAKEKLLLHTHNGMVLLLHPTSSTNAAILDDLLTAWEREGYRFGTLDELTQRDGAKA